MPAGLGWNQWLGQAAERPFNKNWLGWMYWQDFAGGTMTNWGAHGVDRIQWALGADATGPVEIRPLTAGPNGQVAMTYADGVVVNFILAKGPMGGAVFIGEKGKLEINHNKITSNPPEIAAQILANIARHVGRPLRWNPVAERFIDDRAADALLIRERRRGFELPT